MFSFSQKTKLASPKRYNIPVPILDDSIQCSPTKNQGRSRIFEDSSNQNNQIIPSIPFIGNVPKITGETLIDLITGKYEDLFDEVYIIDCRFDYEYKGGHITSSVNINSTETLNDFFFTNVKPKSIIVFHCEFSHNRGPQMASVFRETDRNLNKMIYPNLHYPHTYILDGGYRLFYQNHEEYCDGGYVTMLDDEHRANGDLIKATNMFQQSVDKMNENQYKPAPSDVQKSSYEYLKSPTLWGSNYQSPVAAKMLNFFSSPVRPTRTMRPDP